MFKDFFAAQRKPMTTDRLCESVLQILIVGNLSFNQAENPKLVALLKEAFPQCNTPNRKSVFKRLKKEAGLAKTGLVERCQAIDSKVSLALDGWHSKVGNMEFLGTSL
jgi:hypothetical protein